METLDEMLQAIVEKTNDTVLANSVLEMVKQNLESDKPNIKVAAKCINTSIVKRYIRYLVNAQLEGTSILEYDAHCLQMLIYILQTIYNYSGDVESPVSDYDYDRLYELLENYNDELITVPPTDTSKIANHTYTSLRGTLKKVYALDETEQGHRKNRRPLDAWVSECERIYKEATGTDINLNNEEVYVFPKWDGVSVTFEFDETNHLKRALTRGNTETNEAQDVTWLFVTMQKEIKDTNMDGKAYGLKTEVMVSEKDKTSYNKKYGTTYHSGRSIASAIINSNVRDGKENLLEVIRLRTCVLDENGNEKLQELASNVFERPFLRCQLSQRGAIRKFAEKHRSIKGLNTDGVVIYIIDERIRKILGRKDHKNQYEVAYKYAEEIGYTQLENIQFNVTTFGRIFPVAKVKKIQLKGNDITSVSLESIANMQRFGLRKGDTVKIFYEIRPYLVMDPYDDKCVVTDNPVIQLPKSCPECGDKVELSPKGTILTCINPNCPARQRGKIINYANKIGLRNIGDATAKALMDAHLVEAIPDLYLLKDKKDLMKTIPGFDTVSVDNIVNDIEAHKSIPASVLLSAIGIESLGKKTAEKLLARYTIDELIQLSEEGKVSALMGIPDIGDKLAKSILDGIWLNMSILEKLHMALDEIVYEDLSAVKFIAVFHNIRSRKLTMEMEMVGGKVEDNLTKHTTFLIVPNGYDGLTATGRKARDYNIPIVEIRDVPKYIKQFN